MNRDPYHFQENLELKIFVNHRVLRSLMPMI